MHYYYTIINSVAAAEGRSDCSYRPAEVDAAEQYHTAEPDHSGRESQMPVH